MPHSRQHPTPERPFRTPAWTAWIAAGLAVAGMAFRARLNFATSIAPSMDAAYYPMQAWWLLEHGRLMYQDMPLLFLVHAACGKTLATITGLPLDNALMQASRWVDCIVPPLIAFPTVALAMRWGRPTSRRERLACAMIGIAGSMALIVGPPALWMLGDFQKNSAALVLLTCCVWALQRGFDRVDLSAWPRWRPGVLFTLLTACTHAGTLGALPLIMGLGGIAWAFLRGRRRWRTVLVATTSVATATALLLACVWLFSPNRAGQLLQAPTKLLGADRDRLPRDPGGPSFGDVRRRSGRMHRDEMRGPPGPGSGMGGGPRPGLRGPPPDMGPPGGGGGGGAWLWTLAGVGGIAAIARACADRRSSASVRSLGLALGATGMLLATPLTGGEYAQRLSLMAAVPAALALTYAAGALAPLDRWRWSAFAVAAGLAVMTAVPLLSLAGSRDRGPRDRMSRGLVKEPVIEERTLEELRSIGTQLDDPEHTLVVARHGLQWWAGHVLHTPVRNTVPDDAFTRYRRVLVLRETRGGPDGPPGMPPAFPAMPEGDVVFNGDALTLKKLSESSMPPPGDDPGPLR